MKRMTSLVAATVAATLGLGTLAFAAQPQDPASQPAQSTPESMPSSEQSVTPQPSNEPSASSPDPSTTAPSGSPEAATSSASSAALASPAEQNTRLAAAVPPGMSAQEACGGFKSISECATTLHAAQNLNIPFGDLKSKVTGGQNLAAAIHDLQPGANAKAEVRRAEEQARSDLHAAPQG
jgi:hypothetical protein